jgi:hypothetical protein
VKTTSATLDKELLRHEFKMGGRLELMGATEVAEELGVRMSNLGQQRDLPNPVARLARGDIWLASDIREFRHDRAERRIRRGWDAADEHAA